MDIKKDLKYCGDIEDMVDYGELRAEARKWVDAIRHGKYNILPDGETILASEAYVACAILEHIFNLDE